MTMFIYITISENILLCIQKQLDWLHVPHLDHTTVTEDFNTVDNKLSKNEKIKATSLQNCNEKPQHKV